MMFHVVTLFPEMFASVAGASILGRAIDAGHVSVELVNPRDFTHDSHRTVDAPPYGGGPGMVLMAPPLFDAVEAVRRQYAQHEQPPTVLLSPQGTQFNQRIAGQLANEKTLILVCGHYEGIDERFVEHCVDLELSLGDFVMTGGELPAMAVIDAVARLVPGVLGDASSANVESFSDGNRGLLDAAVYTKPADFRGWRVPDVLVSGDHAAIERFRRESSATRTLKRRPDLMKGWTSDNDGDDRNP